MEELNFIQTFLVLTMILSAVGMLLSMLLLTWAMISTKAIISVRKSGLWIMICLIVATIAYMLLTAIS